MQTRKYPRTLQEAFGPYTSRHIAEPMDKPDVIVAIASAAACVALLVILWIWG